MKNLEKMLEKARIVIEAARDTSEALSKYYDPADPDIYYGFELKEALDYYDAPDCEACGRCAGDRISGECICGPNDPCKQKEK